MIKFSLPQQSQVKLMVFNIKGQLVRILADRTFTSGIHQIMWNGKDDTGRIVASGTYVYQLLSGNQNLSRKLVLSK
jgi:flagellar hook assembly protein FlgD